MSQDIIEQANETEEEFVLVDVQRPGMGAATTWNACNTTKTTVDQGPRDSRKSSSFFLLRKSRINSI